MLTKLIVQNFKRFGRVEIELGNPVVFIGPNNSGKTSALQALALWDVGLKRWNEKRKGKRAPEKRPGVTINRRDLMAIPTSNANLLWRDLHVRDVQNISGKPKTQNVRIDILVEGVTEDKAWTCGLEFDYANEESFYCRPLRLSNGKDPDRMRIPEEAEKIQIAFLPPMSGLAANETRLDPGAIHVRIGEGRTAEVLRNLCYKIYEENREDWEKIADYIESLFGVELKGPEYIAERGEITMGYRERGTLLDLSSSGRGLQQTLLILAYMYANPNTVLLLDEPDAHLEILRQRQIYQMLIDVGDKSGSQLIIASHSEVLLNEAADRDVVVAFVGKPHRIDDRGSQIRKALREIGFEHYYLAEQTGWVLYLEGATDLAILRSFAEKLDYPEALQALERPFVHYVGNQPNEVRRHFYGVREAVPDLKGVAIFDRLDRSLPEDLGAKGLVWKRREIENYLCYPQTLEAYARAIVDEDLPGPLFAFPESERRVKAMQASIREIQQALETLGKGSPWDPDTKVSDDFLVPLFKKYFKELGLPNVMAKKNFHELARFVPKDKIDPELKEKLDAIVEVAHGARPVSDQ
ncbi:MAG: AAA family ATPase [Candidatus Latescibacteria bacterium]|nr:AAA family ATPase [Candidatus Latescibacterota bacterium]